MSAHASQGSTDDDAELAELRRRAYGPDADIGRDPAALARLDLLEDKVRARWATEIEAPPRSSPTADPATANASAAEPTMLPAAPERRRAPRWHSAALAVTAAAALALGAIAWTTTPITSPPAAGPTIAPVADQRWSTSSEAGYREFLDHLRTEALASPGLERIADRIVLDDLRPFGGLYGRKVWAGPTADGEYCMIVIDRPTAVSACVSMDEIRAVPLTITLPAAISEAEAEVGLDASISYILQRNGTVIAEPAVPGTIPQQ